MNRPGDDIRRRLLGRSAYIFAIRLVPAMAILLVNILFARLLPQSLNGRYQQIWVYLAVFVAIGAIGIPALLATYSPGHIHRWLSRLQARHAALFLLLNLVLGGWLAWFLRGSGVPLTILCGLYLSQVAVLMSETYLIVRDRYTTLLAVVCAYTAAFVALHLAFLRGSLSFGSLLCGVLVILLVRGTAQGTIGIALYRRQRSGRRVAGMPRTIRRQWLQLGIYDISQLLFRWLDKLIVGWLIAPAGFAIYFTGTMDIPMLPLLLGAAGTALLRQLAAGSSGTTEKLAMMHFTAAGLARIVFPVFAFLFVFRAEIILGVFGTTYAAAIPLFAISVMAIPLRAYNFTAMLQHLNRVRLINIGALLDLGIALGLAYPLYLWLGLEGVAVAFTACSYFQALFYLYHTSRLLRRPIGHLVPVKEWSVLMLIYVCAELAFRSAFHELFPPRLALFAGAAITVIMISGSLYPILRRKPNGA